MYYQLKHSEGFSSRVWHINVLIMLMLMLCSKPLCGQSSLSPLHVDGPFLVNAEGVSICMALHRHLAPGLTSKVLNGLIMM